MKSKEFINTYNNNEHIKKEKLVLAVIYNKFIFSFFNLCLKIMEKIYIVSINNL